jgi:hypothetical protein
MTRHIALQNATAFDIRQLEAIMRPGPVQTAAASPRDSAYGSAPRPQRTDDTAVLGAWGEWRGL